MRLCPVSVQIDPDCFASERIRVEVVFEIAPDAVRYDPIFAMLPSGRGFAIPEIDTEVLDTVSLKGGER